MYHPVAAGGSEPGDRMKSAWFIGTAQGAGGATGPGIRPDRAPGAGDGSEPTTAVTVFRNKPGAPELLPMQGVGGPGTGLGTSLPPRVWAAYQDS